MSAENFDWERPLPWDMGGYSPTTVANEKQHTGMMKLPPTARCEYCHEPLAKLHGLTPQGQALGWFLRGKGPWCYGDNLRAWEAWKRGLYFGKTALNGW